MNDLEFFTDDQPAIEAPEMPVDWLEYFTEPAKPVTRSVIHWANEYTAQPKPIEYVVEGVINQGSLNIWYGDPGVGKTWAALDLAIAVASGEAEWLGRKIKNGAALFIDEESGENRLGNRIYMTKRGHGAGDDIPLAFTSFELFNFREESHADKLAADIRETGAIIVFVDTLADVTMGADENSVKDLLPALINLRRVAEQTRAAIVVLHHPNKSGGYRGSSAILGKCDSLVKISGSKEDATITIESEKARDNDPFKMCASKWFSAGMFNLSPVEQVTEDKPKRLNKSQQYVLDWFIQHGEADLASVPVEPESRYTYNTVRTRAYDLKDMGLLKVVTQGTGKGSVPRFAPAGSVDA